MNKFQSAFNRKKYDLSTELNVTTQLLLKLQDEKILTEEQCQSLHAKQTNIDKAAELLRMLERRVDSEFDVFCSVLIQLGQLSVVKIIRPEPEPKPVPECTTKQDSACIPEEQHHVEAVDDHAAELGEIIEIDYGLPDALYVNKVITREQCEEMRHLRRTAVDRYTFRVNFLLKVVLQHLRNTSIPHEANLRTLKGANSFRSSLHETHQSHVVNYIEHDGNYGSIGSTEGDIRPLNQQQRLKMHPHPSLTEDLNYNAEMQVMLMHKKVLTRVQNEDIIAERTRTQSNERLLLIMKRRSVADAKIFIECLSITGQKGVVEKLTELGVVVIMHTTINSAETTNDQKKHREGTFAKIFNRFLSKCHLYRSPEQIPQRLSEACSCFTSSGYDFLAVEPKNSIAWHIMCRTMKSLENLREMYNSNEIGHVLGDIFNCVSDEKFQLRVEWDASNYQLCRNFLKETSVHLFGPITDSYESTEDSVVSM